MDPKAMLMLYSQPKPEVGLDLEIQVENALKAPGMAQLRDLLSSLTSSIPGATLASGSALALLATLYLARRSNTSSTALAALTAEYEAYCRVQGKKYAALLSENTALKQSHAAYRRESFAMKTRVVQFVSEEHLRTEEGLRARIHGVLMPRIEVLEKEKRDDRKVLGRVIEGYAKEMWALKRENKKLKAQARELEADKRGLETENRDFLERIVELEESGNGGDEGVVAENAKLKTQNTQLKTQTTRLEAQNTHLKRKNTELETQSSATESENATLKRKHTELEHQNTGLVSKTSQLQTSLSTITSARNAASSENQALHSALRESHDAVQRADKNYTSGLQTLKKLLAHAKEEHHTELRAKDNEITTLRANLTLKVANEAILQNKLQQTESELDSKAEENAKLQAERDAMAEKAIDRQHKLLKIKSNVEKEIATRTDGIRAELDTANASLKTSTAAKVMLEKQITEARETRSKLEGEVALSKSLQSTTATKLAVFRDSWAQSKDDAVKRQKEGDDAQLAKLGSRIVDLEAKLDSAVISCDAFKISEKDFEKRLQNANDEIEKMRTDHEAAVLEYELKLGTLGAMIAAQDGLDEVSNADDDGFTTPQEGFSVSEADALAPSKPSSFGITAGAFSPEDVNEAESTQKLEEPKVEEAPASQSSISHTSQKKRRVRHPKITAYKLVLTCKERTTRFEHLIEKASNEDGITFDGIDCQDLARETRGWVRRDIDRAVDIAMYRARGEAMKNHSAEGSMVVTKDDFRHAVQQVREHVKLEMPGESPTLQGEKEAAAGPEGTSKTTESQPSSGTMARDRPPPTPDQRLALFKEYRARDISRQTTMDWSKIAAITDGFRGRDIQDTLNQAIAFANSKKREVVSQYDLEKTIRRLRTERDILKASDQPSSADGERANNDLPPLNNEAKDADTPKSSPGSKIPQACASTQPRPQDSQSSPDAERSSSTSLSHLPVRRLLPYNLGSIAHPFPASPRQRKIFLPPGDGPFYFEDDPTPYYPDANRRPVAQGKQWGEYTPLPRRPSTNKPPNHPWRH